MEPKLSMAAPPPAANPMETRHNAMETVVRARRIPAKKKKPLEKMTEDPLKLQVQEFVRKEIAGMDLPTRACLGELDRRIAGLRRDMLARSSVVAHVERKKPPVVVGPQGAATDVQVGAPPVAEPFSKIFEPCPECNGNGRVSGWFGYYQCDRCRGTGVVKEAPSITPFWIGTPSIAEDTTALQDRPAVNGSTAPRSSFHSDDGKQARLTYKLHASIWDASIFIGQPSLETGVSSALALCLICNLVLVALFIAVIGAVIANSGYNDADITEFDTWRATIAHDVSFRNTITGESLASGVCNKKLSTPFSNAQILILESLDKYLNGFGSDGVSTGAAMCVLALLVWFLTRIEEARDIFQVLIVCLGLPTISECGLEAIGEYYRLTGISTYKRTMVIVLSLVRISIVAVLASYGVLLLVFEISVEEILLNAVSLDFILRVDELIFSSLAPKVSQTLIDRMLPLALPQFSALREFTVLPLLTMLPLVLVAQFVLVPNVELLRDIRRALCGGVEGSWDFVVAVDAIGIPWAASTPMSDNGVSSFAGQSILHAKDSGFPHYPLQPEQRYNMGSFMQVSTGDELQRQQSTRSEFQQPKDWKIMDVHNFGRNEGWPELEVVGPAGQDFGNQHGTVYNRYLHYLLGAPPTARVTCDQVPTSRCNMHGRTVDAVVIRQLCPSRCGCDDPASGTVGSFYSVDLQFSVRGCAFWNFRKQNFQNTLAALPCKDTIAADTFALWASGLEDTPLGGHDDDGIRTRLVASFDKGGCPEAVKLDLGSGIKICEETSLPAICPESCGCDSTVPYTFSQSSVLDFCPQACGVGTTFCFTGLRTLNMTASTYGPFAGYACVFPFEYKGDTYTSCTMADWHVPWCAVTVKYGAVLHWGECSESGSCNSTKL